MTRFRLDPFNAAGEMEFDYIRLVADPSYAPSTDDPQSAGTPAVSTFSGVKNGDAESTGGFIGAEGQGDFAIVEDLDRPGNHVFRNIPLSDKEMWLYTSQYLTFTTGGKYRVSVDVKLASHGTDTRLSSGFSAILCFNAQYDGKDHVLYRLPLSAADGWKTFTFEFSIDKNSKTRSYDNFCFYSNPVDGKGVGYFLDNIVVEEIEP